MDNELYICQKLLSTHNVCTLVVGEIVPKSLLASSTLAGYRLSPRDAQPHLAHDFPEIPKIFKIVELHQYGGY